MITFALTTRGNLLLAILGAIVIWLALAAVVAEYGSGRGFPWFPLFVCGAFLGWPLVLLAVTVGAGPRRP